MGPVNVDLFYRIALNFLPQGVTLETSLIKSVIAAYF